MSLNRIACLALFLAVGPPVKADVVTDWNQLMLEAIRNESTAPPLAARNLAILHASVYDAVNAIDRQHESYFVTLSTPTDTSMEAAAVGAAYKCLTYLYPSQSAAFDNALDQYLARTASSTNRDNGLNLGELVALFTLDWRNADNSSTTINYVPGTAPGDWRRTAPFFRPPELPQWPYVIPFALTNGSQFRPVGPPALDSSQYAADVNQIKALGALNSTNRTVDQTQIARFWADFSFTVTPPGHWNQIAQNVVTNRGVTLAENARLFALLNIAMADAAIVVWDAKYTYNFWRPITAIREADTDGNPATDADPSWTPLLTTPSFPEYVSGHSTFSGTAAVVLSNFFGTDNINFTVGSDTLPAVMRSYSNFSATAEEIGMSRIFGGIHFLAADLNGLAVGRQVADYVNTHILLPVPGPATLSIHLIPIDNQVQVTINGTVGAGYILEASPNLISWAPVTTNVAPLLYNDPALTNARFYRAIAAP